MTETEKNGKGTHHTRRKTPQMPGARPCTIPTACLSEASSPGEGALAGFPSCAAPSGPELPAVPAVPAANAVSAVLSAVPGSLVLLVVLEVEEVLGLSACCASCACCAKATKSSPAVFTVVSLVCMEIVCTWVRSESPCGHCLHTGTQCAWEKVHEELADGILYAYARSRC